MGVGNHIQELCLDGVEYRKLGELCHIEKGKTPIQKATPGEYPLVVTADNRLSCNTYQFDGNAICIPLISSSGHGKKDLRTLHYQSGKFALGNILCAAIPYDETYTDARFLYFYLLAKKDYLIVPLMRGGANVSLSTDSLKNIKVPVPPLPVQQEIVRILDSFTELTAELSAELSARRKQYAYYSSLLLSGKQSVQPYQYIQLNKFAKFIYGFTDKAKNEGDARFLRITDIDDNGCLKKDEAKYITLSDESRKYTVHKGDLLMARTGATYGKTLYVPDNTPAVYASFLIKICLNNSVMLNRFYWHFAQSQLYWQQAIKLVSGGGQPQFNSGAIGRMLVPVPPIEEQARIVSILDRFDALCNDLTSGLPAEIEARRKQYEYYRDKLLTFPKCNA